MHGLKYNICGVKGFLNKVVIYKRIGIIQDAYVNIRRAISGKQTSFGRLFHQRLYGEQI